jgi:dihydrofolate synthase/folylpolyglutamate synthase
MNYKDSIAYLFRQLPMYQRIGPKALKLDLSNIIQLCDALENPQEGFSSIHIAGTNGKGSTAHLIAAALQSQGLKVGLYTSPHYKDFRERIKINGKMLSKKAVISFVDNYRHKFNHLKASFFEMTVAMAFDYFNKENVDIAIIETGLGGRLDSTNIITPLCSLITNISFDHQATLGNSLPEIASEKAGIIKPSIPVIIGEKNEKTNRVFRQKAKALSSTLVFAEDRYACKELKSTPRFTEFLICDLRRELKINAKIPIHGSFQHKNLVSTIVCLEVLAETWHKFTFDLDEIARAWENILSLTNYIGRWQIINERPLIVADSAHNLAGWKYVLDKLSVYEPHQIHFVLGFSKDKDLSGILANLPIDANFYFLKANVPRGMDAIELASLASKFNLKGKGYSTPRIALAAAKRRAKNSGIIFIGGSVFTVAEFL